VRLSVIVTVSVGVIALLAGLGLGLEALRGAGTAP
jgi:hypothetical protein